MYCVRKTPTRTDSDSTNICETSFWEIQCELKVAKKEKKACLLLIITILSHSEASGLTKIRHAGGAFGTPPPPPPQVTIVLAARADTSRSDLERKTNKNKLQHSPRGHTPRTATRKYKNETKTDYNTRHRSD